MGYQDLSECQEYVAECDAGYVNINGQCYFENEIKLLQNFIINSDSIDMTLDTLHTYYQAFGNKNGIVEPLELGKQYWRRPQYVTDDMLPPPPELLEVRGRLFSLKASNLSS